MTKMEHLQALDAVWDAWQEARLAVRWLQARCPEASEVLAKARQDRADRMAEYMRLRKAL